MEQIDLILLGTGSAIPTISRSHTSNYLKYKEKNFLIDCGEGTQRQIRKAKLNPCKITDILITHFHADHVLGIPGLLHTLSKSEYNKKLNIYCPPKTKKEIETLLNASKVHNINYEIKEVNDKFIDNDYFSITAIPLYHEISCNGYMFIEKDRLRIDKKKILNLKIEGPLISKLTKGKNINLKNKKINYKDVTYLEKGRKISFVFDTKICTNVNKLIKNSDLAIMEGVFIGNDKRGKEMSKKYMHLTLEEASNSAKKGKVKKLIITHISQRYEFKDEEILKIAKKIFPNTQIAKDLMKIKL